MGQPRGQPREAAMAWTSVTTSLCSRSSSECPVDPPSCQGRCGFSVKQPHTQTPRNAKHTCRPGDCRDSPPAPRASCSLPSNTRTCCLLYSNSHSLSTLHPSALLRLGHRLRGRSFL